jgi:hypothetical protein
MARKISTERDVNVQNRAKIMFKSLSADLKPLFNWLRGLNVLDESDVKDYLDDPTMFFKQLRNGYILSKLSIVAIKMKSEDYRSIVCSSPKTR